jgi:hypothetical protein
MDYYPTTGTVKTSMNHPSQGKTQLFRRDLTESEFQQVLKILALTLAKGTITN